MTTANTRGIRIALRGAVTMPAAAVLLMLLASCGTPKDAPTGASASPGDRPVVYVVNYPLRYFVERIGGGRFDVRFPAPPGEDPAYWQPDPEVVNAYQQAELIVLNGAGYAGWTDRAALPPSTLVESLAGATDRLLPLPDRVTHSHGPQGEHEHGGLASTTWLDPTLAVEQARAVAAALTRLRPQHEAEFAERMAALERDWVELDLRLAAAAERIADAPLLFSHPVYQYLERRYELDGRSLHWEPEADPDLDELREVLSAHAARWMIWEADPPPGTVQALEALGVRSVTFTPCGNTPPSGDLLDAMQANAAALERIAAETAR